MVPNPKEVDWSIARRESKEAVCMVIILGKRLGCFMEDIGIH